MASFDASSCLERHFQQSPAHTIGRPARNCSDGSPSNAHDPGHSVAEAGRTVNTMRAL